MPSSGGELDLRAVPVPIPKSELWSISLLDALRSEIERLTARRQNLYVRALAHRQGGQLVPGSLCEELAENGSQLRHALDRYTERPGAGRTDVCASRLAAHAGGSARSSGSSPRPST
jgi:hypothetical protein